MKFVPIISPGSLRRFFYFLCPGENGSLLSATSRFIQRMWFVARGVCGCHQCGLSGPGHLLPRVALFNPVSFRIRFVARCADTSRQFDFSHCYHLLGRYKYCQGPESSPPEFNHPRPHNDNHAQVRSIRHVGLRPPVDGFCPVSSLGAMWWNGLEYVHVLYDANTPLTDGVLTHCAAGPTTCDSGSICMRTNEYYSQCT